MVFLQLWNSNSVKKEFKETNLNNVNVSVAARHLKERYSIYIYNIYKNIIYSLGCEDTGEKMLETLTGP